MHVYMYTFFVSISLKKFVNTIFVSQFRTPKKILYTFLAIVHDVRVTLRYSQFISSKNKWLFKMYKSNPQ